MASKKLKANDPGPSPPAGSLMRVESVPIETVHPDPANVRRHPARNLDAIRASLARFGQQKPIVVDPKGVIRAGNGTYEAARSLGWPEIRIVRTDLAGSEATAYSIADNRSADLAEWDDTALAETLRALQADHVDLSAVGYEDAEVDALLEKIAAEHAGPLEPAEDPGPRIDHAAELQEKWQTARGQLWTIASNSTPAKAHRLLCGDSTKAEDVARLMGDARIRMVWTDPPYGVSYGAKNEFLNTVSPGNRIQTPIENDQLSEAETEQTAREALTLACDHGETGASCYVACPAGTLLPHFIAAVACSGFAFKHSLVWVKNQFVLGRCDYHYRHEIILYGWKAGSHYFVDDHTKDSVFEVSKPHVSDLHPTTKPTELIVPMVCNSSRPSEIVYDCFAGSGSTLVACEQTGRVGFACELAPSYCAVVLDRLSGMGLTPELLA